MCILFISAVFLFSGLYAENLKDCVKGIGSIISSEKNRCEIIEASSDSQISCKETSASGKPKSRIAIITDSQGSAEFGKHLHGRIRSDTPHAINYYSAFCSARIDHYVKGGFTGIPRNCTKYCESKGSSCTITSATGRTSQSAKTIMAQNPAIDSFVIVLGDNHFSYPAGIKTWIPKLVKPIIEANKKCFWVSPTVGIGKFTNKDQVIDRIKQGLASVERELGRTCTLIDSYNVGGDVLKSNSDKAVVVKSLRNDPMGLHPSGAGARLWADGVYSAIKDKFCDPL
jgi:hypothetical protein